MFCNTLNQDKYLDFLKKIILLINADSHFNVLPTYYIGFNCSKFQNKLKQDVKHKKHMNTRAQSVKMVYGACKAQGTRGR